MAMAVLLLLLLACNAASASVGGAAARAEPELPCPEDMALDEFAMPQMPKPPCCGPGSSREAQKTAMMLAAKAAGRAAALAAASERQISLAEAASGSPADAELAGQAAAATIAKSKAEIAAKESAKDSEKAAVAVKCFFQKEEWLKLEKDKKDAAEKRAKLEKQVTKSVQDAALQARLLATDKYGLKAVKLGARNACLKAAYKAKAKRKAENLARFKAERAREQKAKNDEDSQQRVLKLAKKKALAIEKRDMKLAQSKNELLVKRKDNIVEFLQERVDIFDKLLQRAKEKTKAAAAKLSKARQATMTLTAKAAARTAMAAGAGSRALAAAKAMLLQEKVRTEDDSALGKAKAKAAAMAQAQAEAATKVEAARKSAAEEAAKIARTDAALAEQESKFFATFYAHRLHLQDKAVAARDKAFKMLQTEQKRLNDLVNRALDAASKSVKAKYVLATETAEYEKAKAQKRLAVARENEAKSDLSVQQEVAVHDRRAAADNEANILSAKDELEVAVRKTVGQSGLEAGARARAILERKLGLASPARLVEVMKEVKETSDLAQKAREQAVKALKNAIEAYRKRCVLRAGLREAIRVAGLEQSAVAAATKAKRKISDALKKASKEMAARRKEMLEQQEHSDGVRNETMHVLGADFKKIQGLLVADRVHKTKADEEAEAENKAEAEILAKEQHNAPIIEAMQTIKLKTVADTLDSFKRKEQEAHEEAKKAAVEAAAAAAKANRKKELERQVKKIHAGAIAKTETLDKVLQGERQMREEWLEAQEEHHKRMKHAVVVEAIADERLARYQRDRANARKSAEKVAEAKAEVRAEKVEAAKIDAVSAWAKAKFAASVRASTLAKALREEKRKLNGNEELAITKVPVDDLAVEALTRAAVAKAKAYKRASKKMVHTAKIASEAKAAALNLDLMKETATTDFVIAAAKHREEAHIAHLKAVRKAVAARAAFGAAYLSAKDAMTQIKGAKAKAKKLSKQAQDRIDKAELELRKATIDVHTLSAKEQMAQAAV